MAHTESLQYLCRSFFKKYMHKHIRRSKTRNLILSNSDRGRLHIYYLLFLQSWVSLQQQKISAKNRLQTGKNTVLGCIQDALSSAVAFKYAISISSIEFIWFSSHCMQSWPELASSIKTKELVNFLQSQRNPKVTRNVGGTLRLLEC